MEEKNKVMGGEEIVIDQVAPFKETIVTVPAEITPIETIKEVEQSPYISGKMNVSGYVYSAPSAKKVIGVKGKGQEIEYKEISNSKWIELKDGGYILRKWVG